MGDSPGKVPSEDFACFGSVVVPVAYAARHGLPDSEALVQAPVQKTPQLFARLEMMRKIGEL